MWITPNYQDSDFTWPLTIDDKITIFQDRTYGWQLGIANKCVNGETDAQGNVYPPIAGSGYAVLHIVLSYFEMIAKFQDGFARNGQSEHYFKEGVFSVFPALLAHPQDVVRNLLDVLYSGGRCGLYHGGMTDSRIILTGELNVAMAFDHQNSRLIINPHRLVPALVAHLQDYCAQLKDPVNVQLRTNFEQRFDYEG